MELLELLKYCSQILHCHLPSDISYKLSKNSSSFSLNFNSFVVITSISLLFIWDFLRFDFNSSFCDYRFKYYKFYYFCLNSYIFSWLHSLSVFFTWLSDDESSCEISQFFLSNLSYFTLFRFSFKYYYFFYSYYWFDSIEFVFLLSF